MPATSITGSNPGPNVDNSIDLVQLPIGNAWKIFVLKFALTPAACGANTSAEQTFLQAGSGVLPGDYIGVTKPTAQAGLGIVGARVSAADTLAITFGNFTASGITPTAGETYTFLVARLMSYGDPTQVA